MVFTKGMRDKLDKYCRLDDTIDIIMSIKGSSVYDISCFGVDNNGKLSDDRYMIFYNQTYSPDGEIKYFSEGEYTKFSINFEQLPSTINKLVFTVSIDGNGTMKEIEYHEILIQQNGNTQISMKFDSSEFHNEKAIISMEVYRKDSWRIAAIANGFDGGLSALLTYFGGTEVTKEKDEKKVEQTVKKESSVSQKISLKKGQKVSLEKNGGNPIIVENGWSAKGKDYDLKALVRYRDGRLIYIGAANKDELLSTPEGAVRHGGDIKNPGELEHIEILWHPDIASVAVSSYSAIENGTGSFQRYGVYVRIKNGKQIIEIPAANTSADNRSYTLCFGEVLFGTEKDMFDISALEMYSAPNSENRIGYKNDVVVMDIGPVGKEK